MNWVFPYCPSGDDWLIDWSGLERDFDWLRKLGSGNCSQNTSFDLDNKVLNRTKLTCETLIKLSGWKTLSQEKQSIVFAAALLKDVAKLVKTDLGEDEIISSKGHSIQSARITQQILWDLGVPFHCREAVVNLVKYSSLPLWFWDKPNPEKFVIKVSQFVSCKMLALLAEADVKGRYCHNKGEFLEQIEFFQEFCQENHCFHQPREFPSPHSRFIYFQKDDLQDNADPNYQAYDDTRFQVIMMSGLPGSGKDTWIKENHPDMKMISLDDLRRSMGIEPTENQGIVANKAKAIAKNYMRNGESFIWNATNISQQLRGMLIRLFSSYQARICIVYLEVPWEELLQRNKTRTHKVPQKVIYRMRSRLDVPKVTESHQVEWIFEGRGREINHI